MPGKLPVRAAGRHAAPGSAVVDDGSFTGAPLAAAGVRLERAARRREALRRPEHPLFVAGPQVGYFFPRVLRGDGAERRRLRRRAARVFPGVPLRADRAGPDFAWSATSSQADNIDLFVETLCEDDRHYLYRGQCVPMRRFFVGTLKTQGSPDQAVAYDETAHGPVIGYATVGGKKVAISMQRSTRGREILSARAFYELNTGQVRLGDRVPARR